MIQNKKPIQRLIIMLLNWSFITLPVHAYAPSVNHCPDPASVTAKSIEEILYDKLLHTQLQAPSPKTPPIDLSSVPRELPLIGRFIVELEKTEIGRKMLKDSGANACFDMASKTYNSNRSSSCPEIRLADDLDLSGRSANGITDFMPNGHAVIQLRKADMDTMTETLAHELKHVSKRIDPVASRLELAQQNDPVFIDSNRFSFTGLAEFAFPAPSWSKTAPGHPSFTPPPLPGIKQNKGGKEEKTQSDYKRPDMKGMDSEAFRRLIDYINAKQAQNEGEPIEIGGWDYCLNKKPGERCEIPSELDDPKFQESLKKEIENDKELKEKMKKIADLWDQSTVTFMDYESQWVDKILGKEWQPIKDRKKAYETEKERRELLAKGDKREASKKTGFADQANENFLDGWLDENGKPNPERLRKARQDSMQDVLDSLKAHKSSVDGQKNLGDFTSDILVDPFRWFMTEKKGEVLGSRTSLESRMKEQFYTLINSMETIGNKLTQADIKSFEKEIEALGKAIETQLKNETRKKKISETSVADWEKLLQDEKARQAEMKKIQARIGELKKKYKIDEDQSDPVNGLAGRSADKKDIIQDALAGAPKVLESTGHSKDAAARILSDLKNLLSANSDRKPALEPQLLVRDPRSRYSLDFTSAVERPVPKHIRELLSEETEAWLTQLLFRKQRQAAGNQVSADTNIPITEDFFLHQLLPAYADAYGASLGESVRFTDSQLRDIFDETRKQMALSGTDTYSLF